MAIETEFTYDLARFISFRDLSECERVRRIRRTSCRSTRIPTSGSGSSTRRRRSTEHSPTTS